jgi:hypothetical protein
MQEASYTIGVVLGGLDSLSDRAAERVIEALIDGLAVANLEYLKAHPETPMLYASGVRYEDEESLLDEWRNIPAVLALGVGDCDDLVPWRIAELWMAGYSQARAIAHLQRMKEGKVLFHVLVRIQGNQTEDPSQRLGMVAA